MKHILTGLLLTFIFVGFAHGREIAVTVHKVNSMNVGDSIGVIVAKQTPDGIKFTPYLSNLRPGSLQFSLNKHVGCQGKMAAHGAIPGMAAGTAIMQFPMIHVNSRGEATEAILVRDLKFDDIVGRTLVLGKPSTGNTASAWGQDRVACGSLETYK